MGKRINYAAVGGHQFDEEVSYRFTKIQLCVKSNMRARNISQRRKSQLTDGYLLFTFSANMKHDEKI